MYFEHRTVQEFGVVSETSAENYQTVQLTNECKLDEGSVDDIQ